MNDMMREDLLALVTNKEIFANVVSKVPDAQVMGDLDAAVAWAAKNSGNTARLGITGFCWGGRITWLYTAHNPQVKAGVAWYGRLEARHRLVQEARCGLGVCRTRFRQTPEMKSTKERGEKNAMQVTLDPVSIGFRHVSLLGSLSPKHRLTAIH